LLAAIAEYAARHAGSRPADEFAPVELGYELHLTPQSAAEQMRYSAAVTTRLPVTFAALAAGRIHPVHLRIIDDETALLSPADAAAADAELAEVAPSLTFGRLRAVAHRLVLKLDPDSALRRKEHAKQDAHVRRFREDSGNAGMAARELPPDEVLASWQHVEQRALDLRAAGIGGSLRELRVRAYLDLLQERDSRLVPADPGTGQTDRPVEADNDDDSWDQDDAPSQRGDHGSGSPGGAFDSGPGPSVAALVNITVSVGTALGHSEAPGEVGGYGLLDAQDARDLLAAAARHPHTRWCVTALHPDGTAAAHGCARGRHPPPGTTGRGQPPGQGPDPPPGTTLQDYLASLRIRIVRIARGGCDHNRAEAGYRPSRKLAHLVKVRNTRCTAPGCGRPAAQCDLDHTLAWDQGGITCECDLAPLCRHHHRCKQAEGWRLEQPEPGVLKWRTPGGRRYTTTPTAYPV
ncbi:MAG TPA: DUF222 domain-containing protein, partial [Streptosporangiaceae bacterium]|nr:DUF222 domain-containing protein [Streptosporangiaceae bacterium]